MSLSLTPSFLLVLSGWWRRSVGWWVRLGPIRSCRSRWNRFRRRTGRWRWSTMPCWSDRGGRRRDWGRRRTEEDTCWRIWSTWNNRLPTAWTAWTNAGPGTWTHLSRRCSDLIQWRFNVSFLFPSELERWSCRRSCRPPWRQRSLWTGTIHLISEWAASCSDSWSCFSLCFKKLRVLFVTSGLFETRTFSGLLCLTGSGWSCDRFLFHVADSLHQSCISVMMVLLLSVGFYVSAPPALRPPDPRLQRLLTSPQKDDALGSSGWT